MRPRLLLALVVVGGCVSALARSAHAQAAPPPMAAGPPVVIDNSTLGVTDPYATVGVQPQPWFGGLPMFQATPSTVANRTWFRAEYVWWRTRGMRLPALVTTSPVDPVLTPPDEAGVLGEPGTAVLFGLGRLNDGSVSGLRTRSGFWFRSGRFGIESEFFQFRDEKDGFSAASDGTVILARPFFDTEMGDENSLLISYPGLVQGNIVIGSRSRLRSYMIVGRGSLRSDYVAGCGYEDIDRVDWIAGYRHIYLRDQLAINQNLESLDPAPVIPGPITSAEFFQARNKFHGLQLGVTYQANFRRAWLESLIRVAVGNNRQQVTISGLTMIPSVSPDPIIGSLLAQRTNIGNYDRKQFTMIPELGLTLGLRLTQRLHATVGYSVMYFPSVVRASEQIETDVNPTLPPPPAPITGAPRPRFRFVENDYWAQGLNVGAEFRF